MNRFDGAILTSPKYAREETEIPVTQITPSIDPTSPKNIIIPDEEAKKIIGAFGVDPTKPLVVQVSRFDPWKDPFGVVEAYRILKVNRPDLQLGMVGSIAHDDPEGIELLRKLKKAAENDHDIHVLSNEDGVGAPEVAAFQQLADVIVQKSIREGFGLTITEAMWKMRPVVAEVATCQTPDYRRVWTVSNNSTEECRERSIEITKS